MARAAIALLGVAVGCGPTGSVELVIDLPAEDRLSPVDDRLARFTLIAEAEGLPARVENRDVDRAPMRGQTLAFGDVPIAPGVRLELLASSPSGRLLGFGRADVGEVTSGDSISVSVKLRRPFSYVAGGQSLWAFDATLESGQAYAQAVTMPAPPAAVATTPDGGEVVVAGTQLVLVSTSTHQAVGGTASLAAAALDVGVSSDGRWAAAVHADKVSVVDLTALRRGDATAPTADVAGAAAVAVGSATAYVLTRPATPGSCSTPSSIVPVPLGASPQPGTPIVLASAARGLAILPSGSLIVALPCQNALVVVPVPPAGGAQTALLHVPNPTSVAVSSDRAWGVGWDGGQSERFLVLASVGIDGQGATSLSLAPSQALAQSNDLTEPGQVAEARLGADALDPYALSVMPGARSAAMLLHGTFHADEVIRTVIIGGISVQQIILPRMDMETYEYLLVDVTAGAVAQRMRTRCMVDWEREVAVIDDWSCASSPGQDIAAETFTPLHQAVLYGGD